ncbi:MAG: prolyl oligopeptidase family serine peptidase [Xanthobacteraceae bacterium]|nr:prolyl oligopeptidase family serine peptidase [Xanthobacteraceae bacterium]
MTIVPDASAASDDPHLWLEEIDGAPALAWAAARTAETQAAICDAQFERDRAALLDALNAPDRIPWIRQRGSYVYNFWQDAAHPKGLWRRTTMARYRGDDPPWDVLIDVDALAKSEGEDWVWAGCVTLPPEHRFGMVRLSRGGADATVSREFDLEARRFVDGGFVIPETKGGVAWFDADTLLMAVALGGEQFETTSGYARTVRRWRRGTPIESAPVIFEGGRTDMLVLGWRELGPRKSRTFFIQQTDFFHSTFLIEDAAGRAQPFDIPSDAVPSVEHDWLILYLRSDWAPGGRTYPAGALLVIAIDAALAGSRDFVVLFEPTATSFLDGFQAAGNVIGMKVLDNVRSRVLFSRFANGIWHTEAVSGFSELATVDIYRLSEDEIDWASEEAREAFVISSENSVLPPSLSLARSGQATELLKTVPPRFNARELTITQHHAVSVDGTRIPYFQVAKSGLALDGSNACLLNGYGGFEISLLPHYSFSVGTQWLERGGVYVIANIRGGGEFGPAWHRAGIREGKKLAQDDFAAVAKDLIARGVTRRQRLACEGASNGGLLVGNMLTRYPHLFGAIYCGVPLLDMRRYTRLPPGASWIGEYGDPDKPEDWAFLKEVSAYQLVEPGRDYPPILITTSNRDDRVHPGHARKMAAKLKALGYPVYFHEPAEGGHGGAVDNRQMAVKLTLLYSFLRKTIAPEMDAIA